MAEALSLPRLFAGIQAAGRWKWLAGMLLVLLALVVAGMFYWADRPEYRVLFAKLSDRDGGEVVEALERLNIPYRLAESSGALEVPVDQLHIARFRLAAQGLPKGDQRESAPTASSAFGWSQFQEQIGYQRAQEDGLARSVKLIEGVSSARVHLALPRQTSFLRERVPPAASVLISMKPGSKLREEQVDAIRHVVASSVPGMTASQVSVVDQAGSLLAAGVAGLYRGLNPDQLEYARHIEADIAKRIESALTGALQGIAYKTQVTAQIDFGGAEETIESVRQSGRTASVQKSKRVVVEPRGRLKKLSALVVVDESAGLDRSRIEKISRLARQAAGLDGSRGDSMQIIAAPFGTTTQAAIVVQTLPAPAASLRNLSPADPASGSTAVAMSPIRIGLAFAVLTGLLLWVVSLRKRRARLQRHAETENTMAETGLEDELDALRQRVMQDPAVAASVVRLWVRG